MPHSMKNRLAGIRNTIAEMPPIVNINSFKLFGIVPARIMARWVFVQLFAALIFGIFPAWAQSLPTSGLTFHGKAQVTTDLWKTDTSGTFSNHPADTEDTPYWDDVDHADVVFGTTGNPPSWQSANKLMVQPTMKFD